MRWHDAEIVTCDVPDTNAVASRSENYTKPAFIGASLPWIKVGYLPMCFFVGMNTDQLKKLGLFDARVPRYTSYPPATAFTVETNSAFQVQCLESLDPKDPVSIYVHIPFCERLCWFCACRTQGTSTLSPVESYLDTLRAELDLLAATFPAGLKMGRLHWGGGTPTILPPAMIRQLAHSIMQVIPPADSFEFSVEIDPTMVDAAKIDALAEMGMTRASIGIQDFAQDVQDAIGRHQSFEQTKTCVDLLRQADITSLNADLVYGLPHQTLEKISNSIEQVLTLDPDRIALFGYAHVPHMSKRQRLIDETALPDDESRLMLATHAAEKFVTAGFEAIGIDHFAKPTDSLSRAKRAGKLCRNFQGYTDETCTTLIGIGASSISQFSQGYVQNASATAAYSGRIQSGVLAGFRGHPMTLDDKMRAKVIEMIMCNFEIDLDALRQQFGDMAETLESNHSVVCAQFKGLIMRDKSTITLTDEARALTRLIANAYDVYDISGAAYSKAS